MNKIRLIAILVFICLVLIFVLGQLDTYNTIAKETENKARYLNNIFASAVNAKFDVVELTMDQLADRLLFQNYYLDRSYIKKMLTESKNKTKATIGFGFISPEKKYIAFSSNLDFHNVQSFSKYEDMETIFKQTSGTESVFFGRVYYFEATGDWILPVYKRIQNSTGDTIGIVATGISLESFSDMLQGNLDIQDINTLILNDIGYWRVHVFPLDKDSYEAVYSKPLPKEVIEQAKKDLLANHKMTPKDFKNFDNSLTYITRSEIRGEMTSIDAARYLKRYNMIAITSIPEKSIMAAYIEQGFYIKLIGFVLTMLLLGALFVWALRKEEASKKRLSYLALHDSLTGLYNREAYASLSRYWTHPNSSPFAIIFLDLDNFKNINDTFGHTCGDLILQEVANRILEYVPLGAEVVRNGGDEFTVLLHEAELETVTRFAAGLLETLAEPYLVAGMNLHIGASAGISFFPEDGMRLEQLMVNADLAMYQAKKRRNAFSFYDEELKTIMDRKTRIEHHLRSALQNDELRMVYQPQIDRSGNIHGIEALIRWQNPTLGSVPPDQFIGIAEDAALMGGLGAFILERSLSDFSNLIQSYDTLNCFLSINISVTQFLSPDFEKMLLSVVDAHAIDRKRIVVEVTESLFINDMDSVLPLLNSLDNHGITISLDDFGTGYSSLSMLRGLPVKELKVDKSFIDNITKNDQDDKLIRSIITMGHTMNMSIVAEGVEEQEQVAKLKEYGCDIFQGYYYARPLNFAELIDFIKDFRSGTAT